MDIPKKRNEYFWTNETEGKKENSKWKNNNLNIHIGKVNK